MSRVGERGAAEDKVRIVAVMRGLTKRWISGGDAGREGTLVERVLRARGLADGTAREAFLNPTLGQLHDPSLIPHLDTTAQRLLDAARAGEPVVVYGDYDADGVTAAAVLVRALRMLAPGAPIEAYIPHRIEEGYGLNRGALEELAAGGARVVVSVDCGVTAVEEARVAKELGLELFITDHHNPPASLGDLPDAVVVHPRHPESAYPFGELCGAGVAFKVAWRCATLAAGGERVSPAVREALLDLLGLAALGTVADVVPLVDENRAITAFGLRRLAAARVTGVRALMRASEVERAGMDAEAAGFRIAPRLNAAGRLGHAREALELLLTEDEDRADELAGRLDALNTQRREIERTIADEAAARAEAGGMTGEDGARAIVLADPGWHAGVIGIACSRLVERFGRPVVLMQERDGVCYGSCRSIDGYDICAALGACGAHLTTFGGHAMAAGLSLPAGSVEAFTAVLWAHAAGAIGTDDLAPAARYDTEATADEVTVEQARALGALAPFGRSNPAPVLLVRGLELAEDARVMGAGGRHAQLRLGASGRAVRGVAWGWGERAPGLRRGTTLDVLGKLKVNEWRGRRTAELEIVDVRPVGAAV